VRAPPGCGRSLRSFVQAGPSLLRAADFLGAARQKRSAVNWAVRNPFVCGPTIDVS
jgi:hypothetical protein